MNSQDNFQETVGREIAARVGRMFLDAIAAEATIAALQAELQRMQDVDKPE